MNDIDPQEITTQLKNWVGQRIASMENKSTPEAKIRYRTIIKILEGYNKLEIHPPEELMEEKNNLEKIINAPNIVKNQLIGLADELYSLSKEIKHAVRNVHRNHLVTGKKAPPKKLEVSFPDGTVIIEKNATATFVRTIEYFGLEQVSALTSILAFRYPLVSKQKNEFAHGVWKVGDYYVETHSNTETKAKIIHRIGDLLGINVSVRVIDMG